MSQGDFSNPTRAIVLFGASGQLGSAIFRALPHSKVRRVSWSDVGSLGARELNEALAVSEPSDFIFANGLTDPKLPEAEIRRSNVEFPLKVIEALGGQGASSPHRFLTFGTIQENFPEVCKANVYLNSKLELFHKMRELHSQPGASRRFLHFRIHTLYGGEPKPHMFLGQIVRAIRERKPFAMSAGDQLREYHHVDDVAASIVALLARNWDFGSFIELSSGQPIRLVDLARAIFQASGSEDLLQIGKLSRHSAENTKKTFSRSPAWLLSSLREPITGVIETVKQYV